MTVIGRARSALRALTVSDYDQGVEHNVRLAGQLRDAEVESLRQQLKGAVPMTPDEARVLWRVAAGFEGAPQGTMWPALMDRLKAHADGGSR